MHPQPQRRYVGGKLGYQNVFRYPGGIGLMEADT
jgi:hypothetical protein